MPRTPHDTHDRSALLFVSRPWDTDGEPALDSLTPLDPLLGRPLLQRAAEQLVRLGATHLMVVIDDQATAVRDFLKDGERWGCRITYHYPDPCATLGRFLRALGITPLTHYWVGNAWSVPEDTPPGRSITQGAGTALHWRDGETRRWTGWGCFSGAWLISRNQPVDPARLGEQIDGDEWLQKVCLPAPCVARTPADLLASVRSMHYDRPEGICIAAQAKVHPAAELIAPCYIGRAAKIDAGAVIGPHAVVEDGAFVAAGARVSDSIVMPDTYVGAELELDHVIARGSTLVNASLDSRSEISDPELLAPLRPAARKTRWPIRLIAAFLHLALLPLWLLLRRGRGPAEAHPGHAVIPSPGQPGRGLGSMRVALALPPPASPQHPYDWRLHFVATFYPGLGAVRQGQLRFVGPSLRSWRETARLPDDWRRVYQETPCGLLNDAWLQAHPPSGGDEAFASDALAAATPETPARVFGHLLPYLRRVWEGFRGRCAARTPTPRHLNAV